MVQSKKDLCQLKQDFADVDIHIFDLVANSIGALIHDPDAWTEFRHPIYGRKNGVARVRLEPSGMIRLLIKSSPLSRGYARFNEREFDASTPVVDQISDMVSEWKTLEINHLEDLIKEAL